MATDSLATKENKRRCTLELDSTCKICGSETEDAFHAVVQCTKARALRFHLRNVWSLPDESCFRDTGLDWFLGLLSSCNGETRDKVILLLWRAWHLRNDIIYHKGVARIAESVSFLKNYWECLNSENKSEIDAKGKRPIHDMSLEASKKPTRNSFGETLVKTSRRNCKTKC